MRDYDSTSGGVQTANRKYAGCGDILKLQRIEQPVLLDSANTRAAYRDHVEQVKNNWSIDIASLPSIPFVKSPQLASVVTPFPLDRQEVQKVPITITVAIDARVIVIDSPASHSRFNSCPTYLELAKLIVGFGSSPTSSPESLLLGRRLFGRCLLG